MATPVLPILYAWLLGLQVILRPSAVEARPAARSAQLAQIGPKAVDFLVMVSERGSQLKRPGPNKWDSFEPRADRVGFCHYTVQRDRTGEVLELVCAQDDTRSGCWQQWEDGEGVFVKAGCVFVPHRDSLQEEAF